jgi:hypothetical protein
LSFSSQRYGTSENGGYFAATLSPSIGFSLSKDLPATSFENFMNNQPLGKLGDTVHSESGISAVLGIGGTVDTAPGEVSVSKGIGPEIGFGIYSFTSIANSRTWTISAREIIAGWAITHNTFFSPIASSTMSPSTNRPPTSWTTTPGAVVEMPAFVVTVSRTDSATGQSGSKTQTSSPTVSVDPFPTPPGIAPGHNYDFVSIGLMPQMVLPNSQQ